MNIEKQKSTVLTEFAALVTAGSAITRKSNNFKAAAEAMSLRPAWQIKSAFFGVIEDYHYTEDRDARIQIQRKTQYALRIINNARADRAKKGGKKTYGKVFVHLGKWDVNIEKAGVPENKHDDQNMYMRILLINPNTTASMTAKMAAAAEVVAAADSVITATQPEGGPASIEGYYDEAFSVPGVIDEVKKHPQADAVIIGCFDDTGLDAARCITTAPVIGIGEAGFHLAAMLGGKFGVVTTLSRSVPALEHNLHKYGLASRCAKVRAAEVPVLELENPESNARAEISRQIDILLRQDGAEAVVLGCAGMADLAKSLQAAHGVPVIDGVAGAVKLAEGLARLGLKTSKAGGYAAPAKKAYGGAMAAWAP